MSFKELKVAFIYFLCLCMKTIKSNKVEKVDTALFMTQYDYASINFEKLKKH